MTSDIDQALALGKDLVQATRERDAALARAEKAEAELAEARKLLRSMLGLPQDWTCQHCSAAADIIVGVWAAYDCEETCATCDINPDWWYDANHVRRILGGEP
jgi:hypothetical protein